MSEIDHIFTSAKNQMGCHMKISTTLLNPCIKKKVFKNVNYGENMHFEPFLSYFF